MEQPKTMLCSNIIDVLKKNKILKTILALLLYHKSNPTSYST